MLGFSPDQNQTDMFIPLLKDFINMQHELVLLADKIDWHELEESLQDKYSDRGTRAKPLRLTIGLLLLKRLYNLGDETVCAAWIRDPYMQYFCGEAHFQHHLPCDPSDLVHFRKRMGEEGLTKIFTYSVKMHGKAAQSKSVLSDTTVQENNIAYPTDAKLAKKVLDKCNGIAKKEHISQRQSYVRVSKQLLRDCYNAIHPNRAKKAHKARRKLRTIANRQVRELARKLTPEASKRYQAKLHLFEQVLRQQRHDKNKIYSVHKPFTACIAKGKPHKKYEYGNKIGLMMHPKKLLILAVESFPGNPHDSKTIAPLLSQMEERLGYQPGEVVYDRGGRGRAKINQTYISTPGKPLKNDTPYQKTKKRKKFRRRAAIEPVIGHLKSRFRMQDNFLHGADSPKLNALLAATAWNMKKLMEKLKEEALNRLSPFRLLYQFFLSFRYC
uniref:IS5 family transposase n=1 Tax=Roseihalotalea indica TaxID=2867963 RepID=A0AA49GN72_9BACT|nr:IS5 family transposase [Tunicatimonas sp. TK19036]